MTILLAISQLNGIQWFVISEMVTRALPMYLIG